MAPQRPSRNGRLDDLYAFEAMDPTDREDKVNWLIPGLLMQGKINCLFGAEKAGKSRVLAQWLLHCYYGKDFLGQPTQSWGRCLYLLGEETRPGVTGRLAEMATAMGEDLNEAGWVDDLTFIQASGMRLDFKTQRQWLKEKLIGNKYDTLVIDPLRRVHGAKETSNDEMSVICNELRDWSNHQGLSIVMIHHTGKISPDDDETRIATWSRGATDLPAVLDWAVYAKRFRGQGSSPDRVRLFRAGRASPLDDLRMVDRGVRFDLSGGP